jgi:hypothetical protein
VRREVLIMEIEEELKRAGVEATNHGGEWLTMSYWKIIYGREGASGLRVCGKFHDMNTIIEHFAKR